MKFFLVVLGALAVFPSVTFAQATVHQELQETVPAQVVEIVSEEQIEIVGTDTEALMQIVRAQVGDGVRAGMIVEFENDLQELEPGDRIFINRLETVNGDEYYQLKDFDRRMSLITLGAVFVGLLMFFAGLQGVRALLSLAISGAAILFILVPALLAGHDPLLASALISGIILAVVIFLTHGFNAHTTIAFLGTLSAVLVTIVIAQTWVELTKLTGFASDASVYLNIATRGALDFSALLLGSIIIGVLGVLDDVAITQASVVQELKWANKSFSFSELYNRAIRVGRDHVGSLVNTLAFAYIGVSLPLVLLYARNSSAPIDIILNQEVIAAEFVRIVVGSIGLILAVPFTTAIAAWWFAKHPPKEHVHEGHSHGHVH